MVKGRHRFGKVRDEACQLDRRVDTLVGSEAVGSFTNGRCTHEDLTWSTDDQLVKTWLSYDTGIGTQTARHEGTCPKRVGLLVGDTTEDEGALPRVTLAGQGARNQHIHHHTGLHVASTQGRKAIALEPPLPRIAWPTLDCEDSIDVAVEEEGWTGTVADLSDNIRLPIRRRLELWGQSGSSEPTSNELLYRTLLTGVATHGNQLA